MRFVALALGSALAVIVWHLYDWPSINGVFEKSPAQTWAYILFFGIIGHHFYLDQKIRRPGQQADLRGYLKVG